MRAAFTNQGQVCLCGSRIYIHKSIYEDVKGKMLEKLKALKPANPEEPETRFGSLTSKEHFNKVKHYENMAKEDSSIIVHQYESKMKEGNFISPMLIENVGVNHPINQDEIFGPIASLQAYENEDELINTCQQHTIWTVRKYFHKGPRCKQKDLLHKLIRELCG